MTDVFQQKKINFPVLKNLSTLILVVESVLEQTHFGCTGSKFSALTLMNLVASTALCRSLVSSSSNVTVITVSAMGKNAALKLKSSADRIEKKVISILKSYAL